MPEKPKALDRNTVILTVGIAALTSMGTSAGKDWLPSAIAYAWEFATNENVVKVNLRRVDSSPISNASVSIGSEDSSASGLMKSSTDVDGRAIFRDVKSKTLFLKIAYSEDGQLFSYWRDLSIEKFPVILEIKEGDGWVKSEIATDKPSAAKVESLLGPGVSDDYDKVPWLKAALGELGVKEFDPPKSNPRISEYHASAGLPPGTAQSTPWGCSFVSWALDQAKNPSNPHSPRCADYAVIGEAIAEPRLGAIAIMSRAGVPEAISGFAGFYLQSSADSVTLIGGNIKNQVAIATYPISRVGSYRWPSEGE